MINQYHKVAALTGNSKLLVVDIVALLEDGGVAVTKSKQVGGRQLAACISAEQEQRLSQPGNQSGSLPLSQLPTPPLSSLL